MSFLDFIEKKTDHIFITLLVLAVVFVFSLSIQYPILNGWDDNVYVLNNQYLSLSYSNILRWFSTSIGGLYMPLTMLTYMQDYSIWGLNSIGYHLQNIFWHIIAVIFIYKIFRVFEIRNWIAFSICLIFAVHPQRVESVVWIAERKDVLCCAFYFISIYFYIKHYEKKLCISSFIFFILAILSKPMAITLPVILAVFLFSKIRTCNPGFYAKKLWPFFIVMVFFLPVSILTQSGIITQGISLPIRLYNVFYNFLWYAKQSLIPYDMMPLYPRISFYDTAFYVITVYIVLIYVALKLFLTNKETFLYKILPIIFCYAVSLLPVSGLVVLPGVTDNADRFSYIPSAFILFGIAVIYDCFLYKKIGIEHIKYKFYRNSLVLLYAVYILVFSLMNMLYQPTWKDAKSIFAYSAEFDPPNPLALFELGNYDLDHGNYEAGLKFSDRIYSLSEYGNLDKLTVESNIIIATFLRAKALFLMNKDKESLILFQKIKPYISSIAMPDYHYQSMMLIMANCYFSEGNIKMATATIDEILNTKSLDEYSRNSFSGTKEFYLGNYSQAIYYLELCHKTKPNDKNITHKIELYKKFLGK